MWVHFVAILAGLVLGLWLLSGGKVGDLQGKRVLVTGASTGVGEQLAYEYARQGAIVVITARRQEQLDEVVAKCRTLSPGNASHAAVVADMKELTSIQSMVKLAVQHMGGLDILVLNHITHSSIAPFDGGQQSLDNVYDAMDVNFRSYVQTTAEALPHLTESQGGLVVVNSLMGYITNPKLAGYVASKHALNGFFNSLRSQFVMEQRDVSVTSCVLGMIDTPNAIKGLIDSKSTRILRLITPAPSNEAAQAIVEASASRSDFMYYPQLQNRFCVFLQGIFPSAVDFLMREMARH